MHPSFSFSFNSSSCMHFLQPQKGDKVKGIHALKKYLQKLGYINHNNPPKTLHNFDDYLDENLESAIKTYQINFNLNPTGTLDLKTVSTMAKPRCGVADIINGTTRMRIVSSNINFHTHYSLFPGNTKWPITQEILTYSFYPTMRADAKEPVRQALKTWSYVTPFAFSFNDNYHAADIRISLESSDHGDGFPFDGPKGEMAHSFEPTVGMLHFDAGENWVDGAVMGAGYIQTAALHELGHVFGLGHSSVEEAIMHPVMPIGSTRRGLDHDDILGSQTLYTS